MAHGLAALLTKDVAPGVRGPVVHPSSRAPTAHLHLGSITAYRGTYLSRFSVWVSLASLSASCSCASSDCVSKLWVREYAKKIGYQTGLLRAHIAGKEGRPLAHSADREHVIQGNLHVYRPPFRVDRRSLGSGRNPNGVARGNKLRDQLPLFGCGSQRKGSRRVEDALEQRPFFMVSRVSMTTVGPLGSAQSLF